MTNLLSDKQLKFCVESTAKWNLAHGSVRSGKTVCTLFRFMQAVNDCPDSQIWMIGRSAETIFDNAIRLILEPRPPGVPDPLSIFRPFCTWYGGTRRELLFKDKTIGTLGAQNEGAIGAFQGKTFSLAYCDEMTLYPESIIDMIDTRLSNPYSMGFASMNPSHPNHKVKQWIDKAASGNKNYYELHFSLDDNPYLDEDYKSRIKNSLSGLFYKRNYLGLWCQAEGAVFDFFDNKVHVVPRPPRAAEYWIAGIDYGTVNPFACVLIGVSTGRYEQLGKCLWAEKEFFWDPKKTGRQCTNSEFADKVQSFLEPYGVKNIYIDPSAEAFQLELKRRGLHVVHANNDVNFGIQVMSSEMAKGNFFVTEDCPNLIREMESYVWDIKQAERGIDAPLKKDDHICVSGKTVIMTEKGEYSIQLLSENKATGKIYNFDGKRIAIDDFFNPHLTKVEAEVWELELEDGKTLIATPDHKILTQRGYVELQLLTQDDMVAVCNIKNTTEEGFI